MKKYALILLVWMNMIVSIYAMTPIKNMGQTKENKIDELYIKAMLMKDLKKYTQSKTLLKQIINKDPKQFDAYLLLSELEYLTKNWLKAIEQINTYLQIIDFKDTKNYLDISWAYFLIGESSNSMDYIIQFIQNNQKLLNINLLVLIDAILKKGLYHFIQDEDLIFNLIINAIFQIETYDDIIFTIFINNLAVIKQIPFYEFNKNKIKDLELQIKTLKILKNSTYDIVKIV